MNTKTTADLKVGDRVALYDATNNYARRVVVVTSAPRPSCVVGFQEVDTSEGRTISGGLRDKFEIEN